MPTHVNYVVQLQVFIDVHVQVNPDLIDHVRISSHEMERSVTKVRGRDAFSILTEGVRETVEEHQKAFDYPEVGDLARQLR